MTKTDNIKSPRLEGIAAEGMIPVAVFRPSKSLWMIMRMAFLPVTSIMILLAFLAYHPIVWIGLPFLVNTTLFFVRFRYMYLVFWPGGVTARLHFRYYEVPFREVSAVGLELRESNAYVVMKDGHRFGIQYALKYAAHATQSKAQETMLRVRQAYMPQGVDVWTDGISRYRVNHPELVPQRIRQLTRFNEPEVVALLIVVGLFVFGQLVAAPIGG